MKKKGSGHSREAVEAKKYMQHELRTNQQVKGQTQKDRNIVSNIYKLLINIYTGN